MIHLVPPFQHAVAQDVPIKGYVYSQKKAKLEKVKGKLRKINGQGMEIRNQGAAKKPDYLLGEQYLFCIYLFSKKLLSVLSIP